MRPPLLLTGGPGAGKTATSLRLARSLPRAAVLDVDDLRHLVVAGHAAPWDGEAGRLQQRIGVENACDLADRFHSGGIEVLISDVVSPSTLALYRARIGELVVVQLCLPVAVARRRAAGRTVSLTEDEFDALHAAQLSDLLVDHRLEVGTSTLEEQAAAVLRLWAPAR